MLNNKINSSKFAIKNRETILPTKTAIYINYFVAVLLFALATIIMISLITYNPNDDCWFHVADGDIFYNKIGIIGAYFSDLILSMFGFSSWWLFIGIFYWAYTKVTRSRILTGDFFAIFQIICFVCVLISSSIIESLYFLGVKSSYLHNDYGGLLGNFIIFILKSYNYTMLAIIFLTINFIAIFFTFKLSILNFAENIGIIFEKLFIFLAKIFRKSQDLVNKQQVDLDNIQNIQNLDIINKDDLIIKPETFDLDNDNNVSSSNNSATIFPKFSFRIKNELESDVEIELDDNNIENENIVDIDRNDKVNSNLSYKLPSTDLLTIPKKQVETVSSHTVEIVSNSIQNKLAEFGVDAKITEAQSGPVVTRYEILPSRGVRGEKVVSLGKEIARGLALSNVRIVETIPGKNTMGIEVPNYKRQIIYLKEIFDAISYKHSSSKLTLALGKDIAGNVVVADLAKMPHLLVAGTTGSGKSVAVNAMILSILFQALPSEVKFIMIDPKMVELSFYHDIPHLLAPVITDTNYAVNSLKWTVAEMEKRYRIMAKIGCKNIAGFNQKIDEAKYKGEVINNPISLTPDNPENLEKWPYIVVIIDELADLMISSAKKIEQYIVRIAQKARAVGIHLIVATQRPSVDVITGLIKANIPTRISFQVTSKIDSRTILDQGGAETLLGQGDMLYLQPGSGLPQRVHGAFVNDDEVNKVVNYLKHYAKADYIEEIISGEFEGNEITGLDENQDNSEKDAVFDEAVKFIYDSKRCSISSLQTRFGIGYNRAARIMSHLENVGMVKRNERGGFELINKNVDAV